MYWCHVPEVEGCWAPAVHSNCIHNEHRALVMRTLGPTPAYPANNYARRIYRDFRRLVRRAELVPWTEEKVVESYSGRLAIRYEQARISLVEDGTLSSADKTLKSFVKAEKFNPLLKASKPRLINARSPRFNLRLATWLKPLEHCFWRALKSRCRGVRKTRVVGKGLNGKRRAKLIADKMEAVGHGCTVFEVDGIAFEAHVTLDEIQFEHGVYLAAYSDDPELAATLKCQQKLKGVTSCGIKYERPGCRASGDFNTGLGNTLVMLGSVFAAMDLLKDRGFSAKWDVLADGDNCLVFVERRGADELYREFAPAVSAVSGQELTVEKPVQLLEEVVFGQSHPVFNGREYVMVRDVFKTLSYAFSGYRHYRDYARHGVRVLKAIAECETALAIGVPVLQAYFSGALRKLQHVPDLTDPTQFLEARHIEAYRSLGGTDIHKVLEQVRPISDDARISFSKAFGIDVGAQLELEESLVRGISFPHEEGFLAKVWTRFGFNWVVWDPIHVLDRPYGQTVDKQDLCYLSAEH